MNKQTVRLMVCAALWTAVVMLGVVGTERTDLRLMFWALVLALAACTLSCHLIIEHVVRQERIRLETLAELMVERARERTQGSTPIRRER